MFKFVSLLVACALYYNANPFEYTAHLTPQALLAQGVKIYLLAIALRFMVAISFALMGGARFSSSR